MPSKAAVQKDVLRSQKVHACEVALIDGIEKNDPAVLRWFTCEILHFPWAWNAVVAMALLDKNKAGVHRWRMAQNPLGIVRTIAKRSALKWNPELLFGNDADKVLRPFERAVSTLRRGDDGATAGTSADSEDETLGGGYWHDEFIDRAQAGDEYYEDEDSNLLHSLDAVFGGGTDDGLNFDWDKIGQSIGLTSDELVLVKARARGVTRSDMGRYLHWDDQKVERVWKAVNRRLDKFNKPLR